MMTGRNQRQLPFVSAFALTIFYYTLSCDITISPIKISALSGSTITVTCSFASCNNEGFSLTILEKRYDKADYEESGFLSTPTTFGNNAINFSDTVSMSNNGSLIYCYDPDSNSSSTSVAILVQDSIDAITNFSVSKVNSEQLHLIWNPVFAYEGLIVQYMVSFNFKGEVIQNTSYKTWTTINIAGLDKCQFVNLNVTSIINDGNKTLENTTQQNIQIETPPEISDWKHTMNISRNGSISLDLTLKFDLTHCNCPGRLNDTLLTIKSHTHAFDDVPIQSDSNCTGFVNLLLPPFANITSIALENYFGTRPLESISFETNPLRNIFYFPPSSVQCTFTDSIMIVNNYSTGCLYYNKMGELVNIHRENYKPTVTAYVSSKDEICLLPLALPLPVTQHCVNISTNDSDFSCCTSNSTVTPAQSAISLVIENYDIILISGFAALGACIGASVGQLVFSCFSKCCSYVLNVLKATKCTDQKDINVASMDVPALSKSPSKYTVAETTKNELDEQTIAGSTKYNTAPAGSSVIEMEQINDQETYVYRTESVMETKGDAHSETGSNNKEGTSF